MATDNADLATADKKTERSELILSVLVAVGFMLFHATRTLYYYPTNMPDEYTYMHDARLKPFAEAIIPNYIYYSIIGISGLFGEQFYNAVKVINAVVYSLSGFFVYRIARAFCGRRLSLFLTLVALGWPTSYYTSAFWPEPFYFTAFWIFAWLMLKYGDLPPWRLGLLAGGAIALVSLVKVHGLFLLPGFALFAFLTFPRPDFRNYARNIAAAGIASALAFATVKFGLAYMFAGKAGLTLLGKGYSDLAKEGLGTLDIGVMVTGTLYNIMGHLLVPALVLPIPIMSIYLLLKAYGDDHGRLRRFCLFAVCFYLPLMLISASFSGMLSSLFPDDYPPEMTRIQARYYNFMFPLFPIIAGGVFTALPKGGEGMFRKARWLCIILACMGAYAATTIFHGYNRDIAGDYPEGWFISLFPIITVGLGLIPPLACVLCMFRARRAYMLYLFVFLPLFILSSLTVLHMDTTLASSYPKIMDKAGLFVRRYLGKETSSMVVVDSYLHDAKVALFHIDNADAELVVQFDVGVVDMGKIPSGKQWLLSIGLFEVPKEYRFHTIRFVDPIQTRELYEQMKLHNNLGQYLGFTLTRITPFDYSVDMGAAGHSWPVRAARLENGVAGVLYSKSLPRKFSVRIEVDEAVAAAGYEMVLGEGTVPVKIAPDGETTVSNPKGADRFVLRRIDGRPITPALRLSIRDQSGAPPAVENLSSKELTWWMRQ